MSTTTRPLKTGDWIAFERFGRSECERYDRELKIVSQANSEARYRLKQITEQP